MEAVDVFVAQIRRNLVDVEDAAAMLIDIRAAYDRDDWHEAAGVIARTESPATIHGVQYGSSSKADAAIDDAANAAWDAIQDLVNPAIEAEAEAEADQAVEGLERRRDSNHYLSRLRYWQAACRRDILPVPLEQITTWEGFRDASKVLMIDALQGILHYAVDAVALKDQLSNEHYHALTWPFDDLTDSNTSEER